MGFIYSIKNGVNGKEYIGQTRAKKVEKRWNQHKNQPTGLLQKAFKAHGVDMFDFTVICEIPTEDLNDREILEIRERNTLAPNGYNLQTGGNSYGCHPDTRKKLSEQRKGNTYNFGKKTPPETIAKLKEARSGVNHHMYGKHLPEWVKDILRRAQTTAKKVDQYTRGGELVRTWDSINHAGNTLNFLNYHISECCKGELKNYKSFVWRFHGVPFDAEVGDKERIEAKRAKVRERWANRTPEQVQKEKEMTRRRYEERKNKKLQESNGRLQGSPSGDALPSLVVYRDETGGGAPEETREGQTGP